MENLIIKTHTNKELGISITSFINKKTGNLMFTAKDVEKMLGHSNIRQAIKAAELNKSDVLVVDLKRYEKFKKQLCNLKLLGQRTSKFTFITEKGLYTILLNSRKPEHKRFRDWVTGEVLPSIRKTGHYDIYQPPVLNNIAQNIIPEVQKDNSKKVNAMNMEIGGVDAIIKYNQESFKMATGRYPHEIKALLKQHGYPSAFCKSGREALRHLHPERAAQISLMDDLYLHGYKSDENTMETVMLAQKLFKNILNAGFLPGELKQIEE